MKRVAAAALLVCQADAFGTDQAKDLHTLPRTTDSDGSGMFDNYGTEGACPELDNGFAWSPYYAKEIGMKATVDTSKCPLTTFDRVPGSSSRGYNSDMTNCARDTGCAVYPRATCSDGCVFEGCKSSQVNSFHDLKATDINQNEIDFNDYKGKVVLVVNVASF